MASSSGNKTRSSTVVVTASATSLSDAASWVCAAALIGLILLVGLRESCLPSSEDQYYVEPFPSFVRGGHWQFQQRACNEIYVVGEGETLHTISDKCGDPFIVERNPHIHDPDDVFPGLVIRITPSNSRMLSR